MSLISLGGPETYPAPDGGTPPARRRRYLVLAGTVAAVLLAGGSATYLLVAGTQAANHPTADPFVPGATDASTAALPTTDASGPSGDASPASSPAPASAPPGASMMVAAPRPAGLYRVPGALCASMDLTALQRLAGGPGPTRSSHTDRGTFGDFVCTGNLGPAGRLWLTAEVRIFPTPGAAAASYANDRTGMQRVSGVGTSAGGLSPPGAGYVLLVMDANLELRLQVGVVGAKPGAAALPQPAIETASRTLARLRG